MKTVILLFIALTSFSSLAASDKLLKIVGNRNCSVTLLNSNTDKLQKNYDTREIELSTSLNNNNVLVNIQIRNLLNDVEMSVVKAELVMKPKKVKGSISLDHYSGELFFDKNGKNELVRVGEKGFSLLILPNFQNDLVFIDLGSNNSNAYFKCDQTK